MLCPFHKSRIKRWLLSKKFTACVKQRGETTLAMLIKNVTVQISGMGNLRGSASVPNYSTFVWVCVGILVKLSFKEDPDTALQVFTEFLTGVTREAEGTYFKI